MAARADTKRDGRKHLDPQSSLSALIEFVARARFPEPAGKNIRDALAARRLRKAALVIIAASCNYKTLEWHRGVEWLSDTLLIKRQAAGQILRDLCVSGALILVRGKQTLRHLATVYRLNLSWSGFHSKTNESPGPYVVTNRQEGTSSPSDPLTAVKVSEQEKLVSESSAQRASASLVTETPSHRTKSPEANGTDPSREAVETDADLEGPPKMTKEELENRLRLIRLERRSQPIYQQVKQKFYEVVGRFPSDGWQYLRDDNDTSLWDVWTDYFEDYTDAKILAAAVAWIHSSKNWLKKDPNKFATFVNNLEEWAENAEIIEEVYGRDMENDED